MPLANQVGAAGPTHLDRVLTGQESSPDGAGHLAREFEAALRQQRLFLIEQGWMGASDKLLPSQAFEDMRAHWLRTAAKNLAGEGWSGDGVRGLHPSHRPRAGKGSAHCGGSKLATRSLASGAGALCRGERDRRPARSSDLVGPPARRQYRSAASVKSDNSPRA